MSTPETRPERLTRLVGELKNFADGLDVKYATEGAPDADERAELDRRTAEINTVVTDVKAHAATEGTLDMAKAFLGDLAGKAAPEPDKAPEVGANGLIDPKGMTLGEAFTKSPAYEEFCAQFKGADGQIRNVANVKSTSFDVKGFGDLSTKTVVTGLSSTSGGAMVVNERTPLVGDLIGERSFTIRDLCTVIPVQSDTFEFVQVTGKTNNAAPILEATTAADPAAPAPAGAEIIDGGYKPESAMTLAVVSSPIETIAHLIPITRRAAADAPQVRALVDAFLLYGLKEEEEDQLANGSGSSPNLRGLYNVSGISTVGSAGTDLDAVVDAIRTIRNDRRTPTGLIIHPNDWYSTGFLLSKDSTGRYLIGDPNASVDAQQMLWGLKVVVTEAATENTAIVGDFRQCVIADRQQSAIYVTDSHKDWFGRNLLAVLAEERIGFGCLDPDAICTITAV